MSEPMIVSRSTSYPHNPLRLKRLLVEQADDELRIAMPLARARAILEVLVDLEYLRWTYPECRRWTVDFGGGEGSIAVLAALVEQHRALVADGGEVVLSNLDRDAGIEILRAQGLVVLTEDDEEARTRSAAIGEGTAAALG